MAAPLTDACTWRVGDDRIRCQSCDALSGKRRAMDLTKRPHALVLHTGTRYATEACETIAYITIIARCVHAAVGTRA